MVFVTNWKTLLNKPGTEFIPQQHTSVCHITAILSRCIMSKKKKNTRKLVSLNNIWDCVENKTLFLKKHMGLCRKKTTFF